MKKLTLEDYRKVCQIVRHIPKRDRAKAKRRIKIWTLNAIDPNHQNRFESLRSYRRMWHEFASKERKEKKNGTSKTN